MTKTNSHPNDIMNAMFSREMDEFVAQAREVPVTRKISVKEWMARQSKKS